MVRMNNYLIIFLTLCFAVISFIMALSLSAAEISFSDVVASLFNSFSSDKNTNN